MEYVVISRLANPIGDNMPPAGFAFMERSVKAGKTPTKQELIGLGASPELASLVEDHLVYLTDLQKRGNLKGAGPCSGYKTAILIFEAQSEAEARRFHDADPFALAGMLAIERVYEWRCVF